ncbi:acyltransferase family protein [Pseudomaricurvus alkylphenolicus]|jgi:1-acyl-sn-glycerol-3-phosphate acyltransferase|uniref:lysophospholipid acyltransferase family protein n=1 Tax=Pseudomaricurvus alkylphenolicus TaxID=1306991 RepID=UPI00141EE523|nr:lysophospholipid acyltransferase family protein [Pseudomaricurvus alkylphenolicus]NIB40974.1 acyltransferase family protein [Pseudomaricurvus alkylphenolicus]
MDITSKHNLPYDQAGIERHIEKALRVSYPAFSRFRRVFQALDWIFQTTLIDADKIPNRPCLFIGNHSLFALDGMILGPKLYMEHGRFLRAMGDKFLWNRFSEDFLLGQGAVIGDPTVCSALMENGSDILVFPGGAHEATKTAAQKYTLQWKQRYGFVKLAAKHGYTIVPTALVGPDEFYGHLLEGEDLPNTPIGRLMTQMGLLNQDTRTDMLPPVPSGALGSWLPKPQHCYIKFGDAIDLSNLKDQKLSPQKMRATRSKVAHSIETMIGELLVLREQNRSGDALWRRLLRI